MTNPCDVNFSVNNPLFDIFPFRAHRCRKSFVLLILFWLDEKNLATFWFLNYVNLNMNRIEFYISFTFVSLSFHSQRARQPSNSLPQAGRQAGGRCFEIEINSMANETNGVLLELLIHSFHQPSRCLFLFSSACLPEGEMSTAAWRAANIQLLRCTTLESHYWRRFTS